MESEKISVYFYENEMARQERHIKRLWIAIIIAFVTLLVTNLAWLWYINQYDFESYQQDGTGINIIGDNNSEVINNGTESEAESEEER